MTFDLEKESYTYYAFWVPYEVYIKDFSKFQHFPLDQRRASEKSIIEERQRRASEKSIREEHQRRASEKSIRGDHQRKTSKRLGKD